MDCPNRPPNAIYCYKGKDCEKCKTKPDSDEITNMIIFLEQENKKLNRLYTEKKQRGGGNRDFVFKEKRNRNRKKIGSRKSIRENVENN